MTIKKGKTNEKKSEYFHCLFVLFRSGWLANLYK